MIYALIALGYTLVYGIARLINFAHGEIFMVGAFLGLGTLALLEALHLDQAGLFLILPPLFILPMVFCALLGSLVERFAYRPLRDAPRLAPLITAIGVSFILQNAVMLISGPRDRAFPPVLEGGKIALGAASATPHQILIATFSFILMLSLYFFIQYSRTGKAMRALADDRVAANLMGVPTDRILSLTFAIGSAAAGAGGVLFGMYYNTINFHDGYLAGLKAFTAAVLGGIGNVPGALVGGILLGVLEGLGAAYGASEWKNAFAFFILIIILILRPRGLLGSRAVTSV